MTAIASRRTIVRPSLENKGHESIAKAGEMGIVGRMKSVRLVLPLAVVFAISGFVFTGCGSAPMDEQATVRHTSQVARWLKDDPAISWLHCQLSGARDGACALDNITQASVGHPVRRSCYGNAPGGAVRLDPRMLRAMRDLAKRGFTFRVTSLAGASHGHKSLHYSGLAFDVDTINGQRVSWGNPHWRSFVRRCRELGATETFGPGDPGHSSHVHVAWPR